MLLQTISCSDLTAEVIRYLEACVTFATMFHRSPVGLKYYGIEKVDPKTAEFLQEVAWQTVCEFFGWQK